MSESEGIVWVLEELIHVRVWGDYVNDRKANPSQGLRGLCGCKEGYSMSEWIVSVLGGYVNPCQRLRDYVGVRSVIPC